MKIRIDFTIDVPQGSVPGLMSLAGGVETPEEVREFVKYDAQRYLVDYLTDNGIRVYVVREA